MKKYMKGIIASLLAFGLMFGVCGCNWEGGGGQGGFEDDSYLAQLTGNETEVKILYASAMGLGAGYADQLIPKREAVLTPDRAKNGYNEVAQYFVTRALYNYNVDENQVRLNYLDWGWDNDLAQKMTAAFLAWDNGNGQRSEPDVIIGESKMRSYAEQGLLQAYPQDLEDWVRENMLPAAYKDMELEDKDGDGKGEIYGCAMDASPQVLLWNKAILEQCGFDEEFIEKGPSTWEEWIAAEEQVLTAKGVRKSGGGIYAGDNTGGILRAYPFIEQAGEKIKNEDGSANFNNAGVEKAFQLVRDLSEKNTTEYAVVPVAEVDYYEDFRKGKIAFVTGASYEVESWIDFGNDLENIGWCRLPVPSEGDKAMTNLIGSIYLSVPNWNTNNSEKAFAVIKSHFVDEVQTVVAERDFKTTNRKGMEEKVAGKIQEEAYNILCNDEIVYLPSFASADTIGKLTKALNKAALYKTYGNQTIAQILAEAAK